MNIEVQSVKDAQENVEPVQQDSSEVNDQEQLNPEAPAEGEGLNNQAENELDNESEENEESEQSEENDSDSEDGNDQETKKKTEKRSGVQRLKYKLSQAEEKAIRLEERLKILEEQAEQKQQAQNQEKKEPVNTDPEPDPDDFDNHIDYVKAQAKWEVRQEINALKKDTRDREFQKKQTVQEERLKTFQEKNQEYVETIEDLESYQARLVEADKRVRMSPVIEDCLYNSSNGQKVMDELAKNIDFYEELNYLPEHLAKDRFLKFEAKVLGQSKKTNTETKASSAPTPISTVGNRSTKASKRTIYDARNLTQKEYEELRQKQA